MLKTALILVISATSALWPMLMTGPIEGPDSTTVEYRSENSGIINRGALDSFFRQLAAVESHARSRPVRIVQYGDSHTKADLFTGGVRRNLLRDFGGEPRLVKNTAYVPASADGQTILYKPMGINGARAKRLREMCESEGFLQNVAQGRPDLIVIAYGSNEVTDDDWNVDSYARMLVGIINRLKNAAPDASVLIIGPPDRAVSGGAGWASARKMPQLLEAQRRAAQLSGAAFWSEYDAMGGTGSMNTWVARGLGRSDHVHFTAGGYYRLANLFYSDLIDAYRNRQPGIAAPAKGLDLRVMRGVPVGTGKPN